MTDTNFDGALIRPGTLAGNRLTANAAITRSQLAQVPNVFRRISPFEWRVWDSGALLGTPAGDDLGLAAGTFATDVFTVQAGDLKAAGPTTRMAIIHVPLPENYEDGQTVTLRLRAGVVTTVADTSCTIDAEVYEVGDSGNAGGTPTDLCTTAAQDMNSLTAADFDFAITPDSLVAGDILEIRISIACNDAATATAVIPALFKSALLYDARG